MILHLVHLNGVGIQGGQLLHPSSLQGGVVSKQSSQPTGYGSTHNEHFLYLHSGCSQPSL